MTAITPGLEGQPRVSGRVAVPHPAAEGVVLVLSLLLCGWMDFRALLLVLLVTTTDFLITRRLAAASRTLERRALLFASISVDLGLLLVWRAASWFPSLAQWLRGAPLSVPGSATLVPVGLSFLALRSLGFVIDVYRGSAAPCATWTRFAAFTSFFPAFVAGPICRGGQLLSQFEGGIRISWDSLIAGSSIFTQGLAKKMLIADRLGTIADPVFANPGLYPPATVAAGILAYSLQIYCDFAGYSDMAIGAARVIGIDLPQNFQMPYLATNIAEFWHRWHITLSTWLRDYIFLPTAYVGSRRVDELGLPRRRGELLNHAVASVVTMLLAGLWHGAGWGFVLWGGAHGVALATHRVWRGSGRRSRRMPPWVGRAFTFVFVSLCWVPFRAASLKDAACVYTGLLGLGARGTYHWFPSWLPICAAAVVVGHLVTLWLIKVGPPDDRGAGSRLLRLLGMKSVERHAAGSYIVPDRISVLGTYVIVLLIASILLFAPPVVGPFVYATF